MDEQEKQTKDFKDFEDMKSLIEFVMEQDHKKDAFSHYTTVENANSILKNGSFWLGCIKNVNDKKDASHFDEQDMWYILSLTLGAREDLPLWAIYSKGADCRGVRIGIKNSMLKNMIKNGKYRLVFYEYGKEQESVDWCELIKDQNMDWLFRDVIYVKQNDENEDRMFIKYRGKTNDKISRDDYEKYDEFRMFEKGFVWNYEKESRLLVHLTGNDIVEKMKKYKGLGHRVELSFDKAAMAKGMSITFGPGIKAEEVRDLLKVNEEIRKLSESKMLSDYAGTVDINLCRKCPREGELSKKEENLNEMELELNQRKSELDEIEKKLYRKKLISV